MHHSYINEHFGRIRGIESGRLSNRTFELLGDSILGVTAVSFAFQAFPTYTEGKLFIEACGDFSSRIRCLQGS